MKHIVNIDGRPVGEGQPVYIIAEIGINHNGDLDIAKKLIDTAALARCDAVKFQKRTPEICIPPEYKDIMRETPWGIISYLEYRRKIEFGQKEYEEINRYCKKKHIHWFTSCWDEASVDFIQQFSPVCYKIASASITNDNLLKKINSTGKPVILSTGMSTMEEIAHAISIMDKERLLIAHSTSSYPCKPEEINLRMIKKLRELYPCPAGYSGHEVGLQISLAAVVMGASFIERHITLDRSMWGSDQSASVEPGGLMRLVRDIRIIEKAIGDGVKQVYDSELAARNRLRWISK